MAATPWELHGNTILAKLRKWAFFYFRIYGFTTLTHAPSILPPNKVGGGDGRGRPIDPCHILPRAAADNDISHRVKEAPRSAMYGRLPPNMKSLADAGRRGSWAAACLKVFNLKYPLRFRDFLGCVLISSPPAGDTSIWRLRRH